MNTGLVEFALWEEELVTECSMLFCERVYSSFEVLNSIAQSAAFIVNNLNMTSETTLESSMTQLTFQSVSNSEYFVNYADMRAISATLAALFTVSLYDEFAPMSFSGRATSTGFDVANVLHSSNISGIVKNVADHMTTQLRSTNLANTTDPGTIDGVTHPLNMTNAVISVQGQALRDEIYIAVDWLWFTLPLALVLSASILLLTTVLVNRGKQAQVWKSSVLPYLFQPLYDVEAVRINRQFEDVQEMEAYAKETTVILSPVLR